MRMNTTFNTVPSSAVKGFKHRLKTQLRIKKGEDLREHIQQKLAFVADGAYIAMGTSWDIPPEQMQASILLIQNAAMTLNFEILPNEDFPEAIVFEMDRKTHTLKCAETLKSRQLNLLDSLVLSVEIAYFFSRYLHLKPRKIFKYGKYMEDKGKEFVESRTYAVKEAAIEELPQKGDILRNSLISYIADALHPYLDTSKPLTRSEAYRVLSICNITDSKLSLVEEDFAEQIYTILTAQFEFKTNARSEYLADFLSFVRECEKDRAFIPRTVAKEINDFESLSRKNPAFELEYQYASRDFRAHELVVGVGEVTDLYGLPTPKSPRDALSQILSVCTSQTFHEFVETDASRADQIGLYAIKSRSTQTPNIPEFFLFYDSENYVEVNVIEAWWLLVL